MTDAEKASWFDKGYQFTRGATLWLWLMLVFGITFAYLWNGLVRDHDDCDRSSWDRCGMEVLTDQKTGVQYLYKGDALIRREPR